MTKKCGYLVQRDAAGNIVKADSMVARQKRITQAIAKYARRHGMYASNVRTVSVHFYAAMREGGLA